MEIKDYPANTDEARAKRTEKQRPEKVVKGKVVTGEKSFLRKADDFATPFVDDVLIPSLKSWIKDSLYNLVDFIFNDKSRGSRRYYSYDDRPSYRSSTSNYDYSKSSSREPERRTLAKRVPYDYTDIILTSRADAEDALDTMRDLIESYGMASIMDLYDICGLSCDYTYDKYGWTDLNHQVAKVVRSRDGYTFRLPRAIPFDEK